MKIIKMTIQTKNEKSINNFMCNHSDTLYYNSNEFLCKDPDSCLKIFDSLIKTSDEEREQLTHSILYTLNNGLRSCLSVFDYYNNNVYDISFILDEVF